MCRGFPPYGERGTLTDDDDDDDDNDDDGDDLPQITGKVGLCILFTFVNLENRYIFTVYFTCCLHNSSEEPENFVHLDNMCY